MREHDRSSAAPRSRRTPATQEIVERVVTCCIGGLAVASVVAVILCSTIGLSL